MATTKRAVGESGKPFEVVNLVAPQSVVYNSIIAENGKIGRSLPL